MTRFIDLPTLAALVHDMGAAHFLCELADEIHTDFLRWSAFDKTARTASHSPHGVIELMPVSDDTLYSFKYVNGHPGNPACGLPTVMAFGMLAEVATGLPLLLSELTLATALRTAATSALAAQALARSGSRSMALIGNGAQAEFQALAFHALLGIKELRVFDTAPDATDKLLRNLARTPGLKMIRAASVAEAVRGADIVTTATAAKRHARIITPDMLEPGMHLNAVGGDCPGKTELHPGVLRQARIVVEYAPQSRVEGEIQQLAEDHPVTELWQILSGQASGREHAGQVTVFDSVGFALEDHAALRFIHRQALARGLGADLALVPTDGDPRDLFGRTRSHLRRVV
ncbi:ornithine cyclodeaminase [Alicycliphilus denitrificans]|uniref:Ornithine cyclodeaminase n=1 Tax=Alicycliphilus denitrificans (strain DSM 14773 / CIP 107495 / K601) TaxID=596154 RepID=F4G638_ALIDK|nr:ornithine cyclodeaminase [Alicycliphilus denitrificans]ADU98466.1 Ornithine cyclodeaminase [Alicycliphilus denitrificans BC]AEB83069.1 Ornithine cyclodeaminase [Alicycliphilus denitrificans K601]GAO20563.1 ornithine cyclodeaminase [Alicycliphilus sp. B1]